MSSETMETTRKNINLLKGVLVKGILLQTNQSSQSHSLCELTVSTRVLPLRMSPTTKMGTVEVDPIPNGQNPLENTER
jgi:hypothetical protein